MLFYSRLFLLSAIRYSLKKYKQAYNTLACIVLLIIYYPRLLKAIFRVL